MAGGLQVQVRQISSYPSLTTAAAGNGGTLLTQQGGIGGPYASLSAETLVSTALLYGPALGVDCDPLDGPARVR